MGLLIKFAALPGALKALLFRTLFELYRLSLQTHILRYSRERHLGNAGITPGSSHSVEQIVWAISRAQRLVPGASCLVQALAAERLLRESGHPARVCIGVQKTEHSSLQAHAWVEVDGRRVIGDSPELSYVPLPLGKLR